MGLGPGLGRATEFRAPVRVAIHGTCCTELKRRTASRVTAEMWHLIAGSTSSQKPKNAKNHCKSMTCSVFAFYF